MRIVRVTEWLCCWCKWVGWRRGWWEVEDWRWRRTMCWTGHFCCSAGPLWEQTASDSPGVSERLLPESSTRTRACVRVCVSFTVKSRKLKVIFTAPSPTCFLKLSLSLSREGGWRLDFWASWALAMWALESRRPVSGTGMYQSGPETQTQSFYSRRSKITFLTGITAFKRHKNMVPEGLKLNLRLLKDDYDCNSRSISHQYVQTTALTLTHCLEAAEMVASWCEYRAMLDDVWWRPSATLQTLQSQLTSQLFNFFNQDLSPWARCHWTCTSINKMKETLTDIILKYYF